MEGVGKYYLEPEMQLSWLWSVLYLHISSAFSLSLTFSGTTNGEVLLSWRITINTYSWIGIPNEG